MKRIVVVVAFFFLNAWYSCSERRICCSMGERNANDSCVI